MLALQETAPPPACDGGRRKNRTNCLRPQSVQTCQKMRAGCIQSATCLSGGSAWTETWMRDGLSTGFESLTLLATASPCGQAVAFGSHRGEAHEHSLAP
jgi:hypothetical protein